MCSRMLWADGSSPKFLLIGTLSESELGRAAAVPVARQLGGRTCGRVVDIEADLVGADVHAVLPPPPHARVVRRHDQLGLVGVPHVGLQDIAALRRAVAPDPLKVHLAVRVAG
eukprot:614335-Prymnesium_polylepis.1